MAFSSGVFSRLYNWVNDRDASIKITASRMDAEMDGIATGLSSCLLKDGTQTVTANIPMATFKFTGLGAGTGAGESVRYEQVVLLSAGAAQTITRSAAGEVLALESTDAGASQGPSLSFYRNSASPLASDQLGAINWYGKDSGGTKTQYAGIGLTLTDPADTSEDAILYFSVMTGGTFVSELALLGTALYPIGNDGLALGLATLSWSDLFLASGGVVNWNNGDVTITHSSNALAFAGASSGYTFDAAVSISGASVEPGAARAMFRARKTSDQAISATTTTDVSWVETTDVGSLFSTPTWTPPAGYVHVEALLSVFNTSGASAQVEVVIYKNNSASSPSQGSVTIIPNGGSAGCYASLIDQANGTDTYRVKIRSSEAVTIVDNGGVLTNDCSYFHGTMV